MCPTGQFACHEPIELRPFVEGLLAELAPHTRARHLVLDGLVFADSMKGDAGLLRRLLTGLVGDAVRRAPAGTNVSLVVSPRGRYTEFRVADEGAGIAVGTLDSGFDARPGGSREDGSGLTFCMLAAEANGGRLTVAETDAGTIVCLALPSDVGVAAPSQRGFDRAANDQQVEANPGLVHCESGIRMRAGELATVMTPPTVLVVEDEPLVRTFVLRALKDTGYGVIEADCAERAIEILTAHRQPIALLLSDVGLPGASGAELVRRARQLVPELPTLLMSATTRQALARDGVLEGATYVLQKPFAVADLLAKVEELVQPPSRRPTRRALSV